MPAVLASYTEELKLWIRQRHPQLQMLVCEPFWSKAHDLYSSDLVQELMKPKAKAKTEAGRWNGKTDFDDARNSRNGLGVYIRDPANNPNVVVHNEDWVLIKDKYPKAAVHFLLIPRSPSIYKLHPYTALNDPEILESVKPEVERAVEIAASELRRRFGADSESERPRRQAIESDDPPDELPPGRDWTKDIMCGIHTHPSMNHMHIHVISVDRGASALKHRRHYNSFNPAYNDFFVPISEFPLSPESADARLKAQWHEADMYCWRCGRNFYNRFKQLERHLKTEFLVWKAE